MALTKIYLKNGRVVWFDPAKVTSIVEQPFATGENYEVRLGGDSFLVSEETARSIVEKFGEKKGAP